MKLKLIYILAMIATLSYPAFAEYNLSCRTAASCTASEIQLFNYEGTTHAELATQNSYANKVCCSLGNVKLNNTCNAKYKTTIIKLSGATNAHAELPSQNNYNQDVCLGSDKRDYQIQCTTAGSCVAGQTCLASISTAESGKNTDLHVGACTGGNAFTNKICCSSDPVSDKTYINGTVKSYETGEKIGGASIKFYNQDNMTQELASASTNPTGYYWLNFSEYAIKPHTLVKAVVSKAGKATIAKDQNSIAFDATTAIDFEMSNESACLPDCTKKNDPNKKCDAICEGVNGCSFHSSQTKNACTLPSQVYGARKVLSETLENQTVVYCCNNAPKVEKKNQNISIECKGEMVKMTKVVMIDGEPAKMNIVVCS